MRIAYAIAVRHCEQLTDGTFLLVGAEVGGFNVAALPQPIVVNVFLTLEASPNEVGDATGDHSLRVRVLGPDLTEVAEPIGITFQVAPNPATPAGWNTRSTLPIAMLFEATEPGPHSVEINADDASTSVNFLVNTSSDTTE